MARRNYWWIATVDRACQPPKAYVLFGSEKSEDDARMKGIELLGNADFEIRMFPTRDRSEAAAMFKGKRLERTHSIHDAARHVGHEAGLRQKARRMRRGY